MSHSCPACGMACYCDLEDHEQDAPDDCTHCDGDDDNYADPQELWDQMCDDPWVTTEWKSGR